MATYRKRGQFQWQVIIRKRGFPPQSKTFETKSEGQAWAGQVESEMTRGVFVSLGEAEHTTFADALERYWNEVASKKRHPKQERQRINRWKANALAQRYIATLRGSEFARYRDERRAAGRAENTIRLELALVSHLFEIARKEWGMEGLHNPLKNIRKPSGSLERARRLNPGEFELISTELAKSSNIWVRPLFDIAIESALRQGMLFNLRWEWVDLERQIINIPPKYRGTGNKCVPAVIPLSSKAKSVLAALPRDIGGLVFPTTANAMRLVWTRVVTQLGIKDLRWHDLRHEAASRLFEKGLHPLEVASIRDAKRLRAFFHALLDALQARRQRKVAFSGLAFLKAGSVAALGVASDEFDQRQKRMTIIILFLAMEILALAFIAELVGRLPQMDAVKGPRESH